jgi:hypothetical protein
VVSHSWIGSVRLNGSAFPRHRAPSSITSLAEGDVLVWLDAHMSFAPGWLDLKCAIILFGPISTTCDNLGLCDVSFHAARECLITAVVRKISNKHSNRLS